MNINWRLTADPQIHHHLLDLSLLFDLGLGKNLCALPHQSTEYDFADFETRYN
jgi:hypothetical protein